MSEKRLLLNGSPASKRSAKPSKKTSHELKKILASTFDAFQNHEDRKTNALMKKDFIFHMTDWEDDLRRLQQLMDNPTSYSKEEASGVVAGFLYHATSHIKAAANLLLDFEPMDFDDPRKIERGDKSS